MATTTIIYSYYQSEQNQSSQQTGQLQSQVLNNYPYKNLID